MKVGRAVLFTAGALIVAYAALRIINGVVVKNGGTALIPDPFATFFAKKSLPGAGAGVGAGK